MKKIFLLLTISTLILTGCGAGETKTLRCTHENTSGNMMAKITYNVDYQDKEVKKVRVAYNYHTETVNDMDGVGTGTDGTTNDTQIDNDGIIDGIIGSAIDSVIAGITDTILDVSGLRNRHAIVQNTYGSMPGFSVQNTTDNSDNDYSVNYVIDYDTISDEDLLTLNLSRDIDTLRTNYTNQGFTCSE